MLLFFFKLFFLLNQKYFIFKSKRLVDSIDTRINSLDIFDLFKYMCAQPLGREITWDYFRNNYLDLIKKYGADDPRLGDLLIDIASSFENEYMFYEVNYF